jgi:hypothetical protein
MRLFIASDIKWDLDDATPTGLPTRAYVHTEDADAVADALSDEFGFCIVTLMVEEVTDTLVFVTD